MEPSAEDLQRHVMRMSRLDEHVPGFAYRFMHLSALSPTTRKSHAERHGKLFTAQQVREFWADPQNIAGCKCSVSAIIVDDNGEPIVTAITKRTRETYEKMKKRGYDWSK